MFGSMHAASTITSTKPSSQHMPIDDRMPSGTALAALDASSDMCTQESNAPMVQMGDSHASIKVQPLGHVVRLSSVAKMNLPSLRALLMPTGRAMMVAMQRATLRKTANVCILFMILLAVDARTPWEMTVARKTA